MRRLTYLAPLLFSLAACGGAGGGSPQIAKGSSVDKIMDAAIQADMPDVALRVASERVDQAPGDSYALARQGDAYRALGRDAAAEASYNKALVTDPGNARAQIGLGTLLLHRDPPRAETAFRRVLAVTPQNPSALVGLGVARDLQGDQTQAQQSYRSALAIQPDLTSAQINLGLSLALSGHGADAVALLAPLAAEPQAGRRVKDDYAVALLAAGRSDEARRVLREEMSDDDAGSALVGYRQLF